MIGGFISPLLVLYVIYVIFCYFVTLLLPDPPKHEGSKNPYTLFFFPFSYSAFLLSFSSFQFPGGTALILYDSVIHFFPLFIILFDL